MIDKVRSLACSLYCLSTQVVQMRWKDPSRGVWPVLDRRFDSIEPRPSPWLFTCLVLCAITVAAPANAIVRNVTDPQYSGGAVGDGVHNDTAAINAAIAALQPGDTLFFPCTTYGSTYLITSQLTINQTNGVPLSNVTIEGDISGCSVIKDQFSGQSQGEIMVIGGNGNGPPNYGAAVALSATANELDTIFTTFSSLGVSPGDYVYLCQGGVGGNNGGTSTVCGAISPTVTCDPSGCRGEVLKVASVSGNTITVTTALHDTYVPGLTGNAAQAQKILSPLTGITVQNITFDGTASNVYGLVLAGVAESTVSGVTSKNVQGAAIWSTGAFNVSYINITVTGAGSAQCGGAVFLQSQGNVSVNGMSISNENPGAPGTGCLGNGAFGLEYIGSANGTITNLSIDATGASGRPLKTTAARWNTFNSPTVENGSLADDNGITIQYYSSHNAFNTCLVRNNGTAGTATGNAGINLFGNYNQYNTFNTCTVSGNGNVQFFDQNGSQPNHQADSHNTLSGGSFTGTNTQESVVLIQADSAYIHDATFTGPGWFGLELDAPATNACVNNNTFTANSNLGGAINANGTNDRGSGNNTNGLFSNLAQGTCP